MRKIVLVILLLPVFELRSQIYVENMDRIFVIGSLREEGNLLVPVRWAKVELKGMSKEVYADGTGYFAIDGKDLRITSSDKLTLVISAEGYETTEFPFEPGMLELGVIFVRPEYKDVNPITVNDLMPDRPEINGQTIGNIGAAALFWNDDVLARATNLQLGLHGFKMRGYDWRNTEVYINGASFNDPETGYAYAGLLNGFIDITKKNTGSSRLVNNRIFYGDIGGYSHIELNPLSMYPRKKVSYMFSNSLYTHSMDAFYATGEMASGWALGVYLSCRLGEGFVKGTQYEEVSYLLSAGKAIDDFHSLSFFVAGSPTKRGLVNYSTQDIYDEKGDNHYNSAWGYNNGIMKNSRQNIFHQPLLGAAHEWEGEVSTLNTSVLFSTGSRGETGLNTTGEDSSGWIGFHHNPPLSNQVIWDSIYSENRASADGRSNYILEKNSSNRTMFSFNSVYDLLEWGNLETTAGVEAKLFTGRYYNTVYDLLGGNYWLNVDKFLDPPENPDFEQFDIQLPNRKISNNGTVGHDYSIKQQSYKLWNIWRYYMNVFKFSLGASASYISYGYTGNIANGKVEDSGTKQPGRKFFNYSGKAGVAYKLTAKSDVEANVMYATRAPLFSNAYLSPRISGNVLPGGLRNERALAAEVNCSIANTLIDLRASVFFTLLKNQSLTRSYYDNNYLSYFDMGISKLNSRHIGGEVSAKFNIVKGLKADFAASYGVYKYVSNPNITLLQENINEIRLQDTVNMKGLFTGNTPQLAITAGGIYESPLRFWLGFNLAYTGQNYPEINPVALSYSYMESSGNTREQPGLNGVFTFNLKGGYVFVFGAKRKKALSLNVHAQNLFSAKGILGAYSPYGMENSELRYAYIYGRTVYLMFRFSF
jgi:hypothetical protein